MRNLNQTIFARQCVRGISKPRGVVASHFSSIKLSLLLSIAVLFLALATSARAQDTTGTILGNITDPSGAAIAEADVTVTNTATGIARNVKTTGTGAFTVPNLDPGT